MPTLGILLYLLGAVAALPDDEPVLTKDYKNSVVDGLAPSVISIWMEKVVDTANRICGGSKISYVKNGYAGEIVAPDDSIACIIRAIDMHAKDAPELIRGMLYAYRAKLQARLERLS
jgi:hypothetical protein